MSFSALVQVGLSPVSTKNSDFIVTLKARGGGVGGCAFARIRRRKIDGKNLTGRCFWLPKHDSGLQSEVLARCRTICTALVTYLQAGKGIRKSPNEPKAVLVPGNFVAHVCTFLQKFPGFKMTQWLNRVDTYRIWKWQLWGATVCSNMTNRYNLKVPICIFFSAKILQ